MLPAQRNHHGLSGATAGIALAAVMVRRPVTGSTTSDTYMPAGKSSTLLMMKLRPLNGKCCSVGMSGLRKPNVRVGRLVVS